MPALKHSEIQKFRKLILTHYRRFGRSFPWRETTDPYSVAVSEFMLQQTGVERVGKKYPAFISAFPTSSALAAAGLKEVLVLWQGLGYNRRALALKNFAERVSAEFGGTVPREPEVLLGFTGIGPYTSCSIPAFAYNIPTVFIDTNIRRVFLHFFFSDRESVRDKDILPLVEETLDQESPRIWYAALMDYGTYLKSLYPNPNRRSAHYSRQAPFENSHRQIRGRVIAVLSEGGKNSYLTPAELARKTGFESERISAAAHDLVKEGLAAEKDGRYGIAD